MVEYPQSLHFDREVGKVIPPLGANPTMVSTRIPHSRTTHHSGNINVIDLAQRPCPVSCVNSRELCAANGCHTMFLGDSFGTPASCQDPWSAFPLHKSCNSRSLPSVRVQSASSPCGPLLACHLPTDMSVYLPALFALLPNQPTFLLWLFIRSCSRFPVLEQMMGP